MKKGEKNRGVLLTIWLILMLVFNGIAAIAYLTAGDAIVTAIPDIQPWVIYVSGIFGLLNVIFTIFLFKWKKWAFMGYCGLAVITFIMNLSIGVGIIASLFGLLGPIILYLLLKSKWNLLE